MLHKPKSSGSECRVSLGVDPQTIPATSCLVSSIYKILNSKRLGYGDLGGLKPRPSALMLRQILRSTFLGLAEVCCQRHTGGSLRELQSKLLENGFTLDYIFTYRITTGLFGWILGVWTWLRWFPQGRPRLGLGFRVEGLAVTLIPTAQ